METHQEIDARSLELHRLVAAKVRANPELFGKLKGTIQRWRALASVRTLPYLDEWERHVDAGMEACLAVATQDSEQATALRQSSPFVDILTDKERLDFFQSWGRPKGDALWAFADSMAALLDIQPVDRGASLDAVAQWVDWWQSSYIAAAGVDPVGMQAMKAGRRWPPTLDEQIRHLPPLVARRHVP